MLKPWTPISFEFFPPRDAPQAQRFEAAWQDLSGLSPEYFSVTFGAGGSDLDATHHAVIQLGQSSRVPVAPHISCRIGSTERLARYLEDYRQAGIRRLVVLRGDRAGQALDQGGAGFRHASDLVEAVRHLAGDTFVIEVACYPECHPESASPQSELHWFRHKVGAGANGAITQYFYNADAYFRFIDECEKAGISIPVRPGVLPITNRKQLLRFSEQCGAEVPRWIRTRLEAYGDDLESIREFGLDVVTDLCERLLAGGAPGLHLYTLNQSQASINLVRRLSASRGVNAPAHDDRGNTPAVDRRAGPAHC